MIIEYEEKYLDDIKDLLTEQEEYIVSIDEDNLDQIHPDFHEKAAPIALEEVKRNNGICYLYVENNKVLGFIMGMIPEYDEYDYLDFKCPKKGVITELIVTSKAREKGIGSKLMEKMESYFKSNGCKYSYLDVFAYNKKAISFYDKFGYHSRMQTELKEL